MGRPYTDEERTVIKEKIKIVGKELFQKHGFKDFRIQQLTKQVGISLGGFYTFYKDKEALYGEIIRDEKNRIRKKILNIIKSENQTPQEFFSELGYVLLDKSESNKLYLTDGDSFGLMSSLVWNNDDESAADNLELIKEIRKVYKERGIHLSASDRQIAAIVAAMGVLCMNRDKIGEGFEELYKDTIKMFVSKI